MKVNAFFLFLFIASASFSQTFVTTIHTELDEVAGKPLELDDGSFLVPVSRGVYNYLEEGLDYEEYIYRISPLGAVTDSARIAAPGDYYSGSLKLMRYDDRVFFWTTIDDTNELIHPGLRYGFLSDAMEVLQESILYSADTGRSFHDCIVNHNNNLLFAGVEYDFINQRQSATVCELNPDEGVLRKSVIDHDSLLYFRQIIELPAIQKYHACGFNEICQFNYDLDFEGILFYQPLEDTLFHYLDAQALTDSTYARCATAFGDPPNEDLEFGIGYYNHLARRTSTYVLGTPGRTDIAAHLDCRHPDSLLVGGTSSIPYWPKTIIRVINVHPSGTINWQLYYGDYGEYWVSGLIATRDGGCLISGSYWLGLDDPDMERNVILIKVNNQGKLVGIEDDQKTSLTTHLVYPNPGTDVLYLECGPGDGIFELYDIYGRQVAEQEFLSGQLMLDTSGLAKGLYQYLILVDDWIVYSGKWIKISD
ncbi:MAG: T9SS type A sorting domain-containing protein [Lentimicrobiaceae bacterium]|nr:T9SS type A sorting domain-containing protein [Lentimicrobiaceae bacterium]